METQISPRPQESNPSAEFQTGTQVIYALHGRATITSIETKRIADATIPFYKIEIQKSPLSRSTKAEPAIWIPIASAKEKGLRQPMDADTAKQAMTLLTNREYYFSSNENWQVVQPLLETCIRLEGGLG